MDDLDPRRLERARDHVIGEISRLELPGLVVADLFQQRRPDPLQDAAPGLAFDDLQIGDPAAILGDDVFEDFDLAGLRVDSHDGDMHRRRGRGARRVEGGRGLQPVRQVFGQVGAGRMCEIGDFLEGREPVGIVPVREPAIGKDDIAGFDFELYRGEPLHPVERLSRRPLQRAAAGDQPAARERARTVRHRLGIGAGDVDARGFDPQRVRHHLPHRLEGLLSHRRGGHIGLDRARPGDPQNRRIVARNVRHPAAAKHRAAHAGGLDETGNADPDPAPVPVLLLVDVRGFQQLREQSLVIAAVDDSAGRRPERKGTGRHEVPAPDINPVGADPAGERVDQALGDERGEAEPDAAIGAGGALVGRDGAGGVVDERDGIGSGQPDQRGVRFQRGTQRIGAVGAGVAPDLRLQPQNPAFPVGGERGLDHRVPGVVAALEMLEPILGPLDRAAQPPRGEGGDCLLGVERHLHSEPAADIGRPDPDPGLGETQEPGDSVPQDMRHLCGRPDLDHVVAAVVDREAAAALDGRRRDPGVAEAAGDDDRRVDEGIGIGIAHEAAFEKRVASERVVHEWGAVPESRGDVRHRILGRIVDGDQRSGVLRRVGIARDNGGDDLAGEADFGLGDQRPGGGAVAVPVGLVHARGDGRGDSGEVAAEKNIDDTVRGTRLGSVDAEDPRARERASQEIDMKASRRIEIVEEIAASEHQGPAVVGLGALVQRSAPYQCSARSR